MEQIVSDASIIVKWFIQEKHSDKALKLRDMHVNGEIQIAAPELLPFEVLNALKYSRLFTLEELKKATISLSSYGIRLYPLKGELAEKTVEISIKKDITIYDASYIALALKLKTILYTADEKLIRKIGKEYAKNILHISEIIP